MTQPSTVEVVCAAPDCEEHFLADDWVFSFPNGHIYHLACAQRRGFVRDEIYERKPDPWPGYG